MNTTKLELTDPSRTEFIPKQNPTNSTSDYSEDESFIGSRKKAVVIFYSFIKSYLKQFQLIFQTVIPDLKGLKYWQMLTLILFGAFNVIFTVLDFNTLLSQNQTRSILKWTNDLNDGKQLWRRVLLCLSGVSAFTTVLYVVLVIHGKLSSYFWGITSAILYGIYAFAYGYVGDAQLFLFFFLPMQFVGIYLWARQLDTKSTTRVKSLKPTGWILIILLTLLFTFIFYYEIPQFSKYLTQSYLFDRRSVPHVFDAVTNSLNVIGQVLLIACYWEQYILWLCVNIMSIIMYSGCLGTALDINLLLVWIMLTIVSLCGLYTWYNRWKNSKHSSSLLDVKT